MYGIIYFQENKFAVSGLPLGSGHAGESQGCCRKPARGTELELVLRLRTPTAWVWGFTVFTNLSYLIFQMSVEVLTELQL